MMSFDIHFLIFILFFFINHSNYSFLLITENYLYIEHCLKQRHNPKRFYHLAWTTKI